MNRLETAHYIFHYGADTKAERDIARIAACQESCFRYICGVLGAAPAFKIEYFLCDSPEEVGRIYGDDEPCNGFAAPPDKIYAVYNERVQCVGFHEDAHLISYTIHHPPCPAVTEGLAMYFDRKWWGIHNMDWTGHYLKTGRYIGIDRLLNRENFFSQDCGITYPIVGAFTDWLIATYGVGRYLEMYRQSDMAEAMLRVYQKTPEELNAAFVDYMRLFQIDPTLEERMESLLHRQTTEA